MRGEPFCPWPKVSLCVFFHTVLHYAGTNHTGAVHYRSTLMHLWWLKDVDKKCWSLKSDISYLPSSSVHRKVSQPQMESATAMLSAMIYPLWHWELLWQPARPNCDTSGCQSSRGRRLLLPLPSLHPDTFFSWFITLNLSCTQYSTVQYVPYAPSYCWKHSHHMYRAN